MHYFIWEDLCQQQSLQNCIIFSVVEHDCKCYVVMLQMYVQTNQLNTQQKFKISFGISPYIANPFISWLLMMSLVLSQMTQNMFQEGLHQVFFKERPLPRLLPAADSTTGEPMEDRLVRWFGTVVNTRILLSGVTKIQFNCHRHPTNLIKLIT